MASFLEGPLAGVFSGVHILPPFPSSGDRGFAPVTYDEIDPRFGTWADVQRIGRRHDVMLDLMINHISRQSPEFRDFERHGRRSRFADLFITLDKVWPDGPPRADDVARIFLRKPDAPFTSVRIEDSGALELVWTSFGTSTWSEQIDLDVTAPLTRAFIERWLRSFADHGVRMVRLDAVGYVIKKPGTSCFMVEPEIYELLTWITAVADGLGLMVLPEVHDRVETHRAISAHGLWTYDFVLPGLVLDALRTGRAARLGAHLEQAPDLQFTALDCHDGIPIRPDLDGILTAGEMLELASWITSIGGNVNHILASNQTGEVDVHQLNATYYAAVGRDDDRYLAARAIQLFARGVPQIYYVGLLAGDNDLAAVGVAGDGRAINRHNFSTAEVYAALSKPVVRGVIELIRLRNTHPAFDGRLTVEVPDETHLGLTWRLDEHRCALTVDLASGRATVDGGSGAREITSARVMATQTEQ